jgi:hypothetical protein
MIPSYNPQRDAITEALMRVQNPPPGNMMPQNDAAFGSLALNGPQPSPDAPQGGAPMQGGLNLPGVMQPGQLPQGMAPQNALAMNPGMQNPGMQQMPRGGLV